MWCDVMWCDGMCIVYIANLKCFDVLKLLNRMLKLLVYALAHKYTHSFAPWLIIFEKAYPNIRNTYNHSIPKSLMKISIHCIKRVYETHLSHSLSIRTPKPENNFTLKFIPESSYEDVITWHSVLPSTTDNTTTLLQFSGNERFSFWNCI